MTVILRDLDKPAECDGCKFCLKDRGRDYCIFDGEYIDWADGTVNLDCPLEEYKEPRWIPVTERLPHYGNYLVSFRTDEEIDIGTYDPKTGLWTACDANGMYYVASKGLEVIAWAPLPKPYKECKQ